MGTRRSRRIACAQHVWGVLGRWLPGSASAPRIALTVVVVLAPPVAAIFGFALTSPRADWGADPILLAGLAAIAVSMFAALVHLDATPWGGIRFDASYAIVLVVLALAGPLPALAVWALPELLGRPFLRPIPLVSPGLIVTVSSFAVAVLAGHAVLELAGPGSHLATAPALFSAGIAVWAVNFAIAGPLYALAYERPLRLRALLRNDFVDLAPFVLAIIAVGVCTWVLVALLGVFALVPLAAVVLLPQAALAHLARRRSIAAMPAERARNVYAAAIADRLGLSRFERRLLTEASDMLAHWRSQAAPPPRSPHPLAAVVALGVDERWDGTGAPFGIPAGRTLGASRVLAVAQVWAGLTAADTPGLSQTEAMLALQLRAGRELDPYVVEAAGAVVTEEERLTAGADFEPRLHRLPLPRPWRRALASSLGAATAARTTA